MASLFFSHSGQDKEVAKDLGEQLKYEGFESLYISSYPEHSTAPGEQWKEDIYRQIKICDAVIFLMTKASCESKWCFAELAMAQGLGKLIFPVRLEVGVNHELLTGTMRIDLTSLCYKQRVERLVQDLKNAKIGTAFFWDRQRSPYPGLEYFTEKDAGVFFSRKDDIDKLEGFFAPLSTTKNDRHLIVVFGASGSGKSSLILAGLIPRIKRTLEWLVIPRLVPGGQPLNNLAQNLATAFAERGLSQNSTETLARLEGNADALIQIARELSFNTQKQQFVLLFIDQAEELLTRSGKEETQNFLNLLDTAIASESPLWIVMALRSEFYLSVQPDNPMGNFIGKGRSELFVLPMGKQQIREAIAKPAELAGITFEEKLIDQLVDDTVGSAKATDALPLLAYSLRQMYDLMLQEHRNQITFRDYQAIGKVGGAIQKRAELAFEKLRRQGKEQQILPTLMKLVALEDENSEPMRRRVHLSELSDGERQVVQTFVEARLLKTDCDKTEKAAWAEVTHEALFREWKPLQEEIKQQREKLYMRSELERLARDWQHKGEAASYLIGGDRLEKALRWQEFYVGDSLVLEFLNACIQAEEETKKKERQQEEQRQRLETKAKLQQQSEEILKQLSVKPVQSLMKAIQIMGQNLDILPEEPISTVQGSLYAAIAQARERWWARGHKSCVRAVAFSPANPNDPDGEKMLIATGSYDRTIRLWDRHGQPIGKPFIGHDDFIAAVTFSPDAEIMATGSGDCTIRLWDRNGKQISQPFVGHQDSVTSVAFSPNGEMLVSGSDDGTLRLWNRKGEQIGKEIVGHESFVSAVAFSSNGKMLLSGGGDCSVRLWNLEGNQIGESVSRHNDFVTGVAFSSDGEIFASSSCDKTVRLWNLKGESIGQPISHEKYVTAVTFSPDGQTLATSSGDCKLRLWELDGTLIENELVGHTDVVTSLAFSPDGTLLASGSGDCTLRLWDRYGRQKINTSIQSNASAAIERLISLSPHTSVISADKTLQLWDLEQGKQIGDPWIGHDDYIYALALSPDGKTIVSGSGDSTLILWDLRGNRQLEPLRGHRAEITDVAFSSDGEFIVSASSDGTLLLWNLDDKQPSAPFRAHDGQVNAIAISGSGENIYIVSGGNDGYLVLWDRDGNPRTNKFSGYDGPIKAVAFSPDGQFVLSGAANGILRRWNLEGKQQGDPFIGHRNAVTRIICPDGKTVLSASMDGTLRLWSLEGAALGEPLQGHRGAVSAVSFSPDGETIISGGVDGTLRTWLGGNWRSWLKVACNRLRDHPVFNPPTSELASKALQSCQNHISNEDEQPTYEFLMKDAARL